MALRVLTVLDAVLQVKMARHQIRDSLIEASGSAALSWHRYRLVLTWWAFRVPVAYLRIEGLAKFAARSFEVETGPSGVGLFFGAAFLVMLVMSVVSALRLLPIRGFQQPPNDWLDSQKHFVREGE